MFSHMPVEKKTAESRCRVFRRPFRHWREGGASAGDKVLMEGTHVGRHRHYGRNQL